MPCSATTCCEGCTALHRRVHALPCSPAFLLLLTHNKLPNITIIVVQGAENFAREFKQLRRSFRFNEYKSISEVNPPNNPLEKVTHILGLLVVVSTGQSLSSLTVIAGATGQHLEPSCSYRCHSSNSMDSPAPALS